MLWGAVTKWRLDSQERLAGGRQGSPFLKAAGLIFPAAAGPGLGRGVHARPSRGPPLTFRVPAIVRSRLSGRPRARHPTVRVIPGPP